MSEAEPCIEDGCDRLVFARDLCSKHYAPANKRSAAVWYCATCSVGHVAGTSPCSRCCGFQPDGDR